MAMSRGVLIGLAAIVVILVAAAVFFLTMQPKEAGTVKIGLIAPLTGSLAEHGLDMKQAALLAVEEINSKGGILGKKVELVIEDTACKADLATAAVQKMITQDNVYAIVGEYCSTVTLAVQPTIMENKKLLLVPVSVATKITEQGYKYTFRSCANQWMQTTQRADWIVEHLKPKTAAMLGINDDYGREGLKIWGERVKAKGVTIVAEEYFDAGTTDFTPQLSKIKAANPDVIFVVANIRDAANILKQAHEIGLYKQFSMLGGVTSEEFLKLAGDDALGLVHVSYFEPTSKRPVAQEFVQKFVQKWNRTPAMYAAGVWDAFMTLKYGVEKAGTWDVDKVAEAIKTIKFEGAQGTIYYDEKGQAQTKVLLVQVQKVDGKLKRVILYPDSDKEGEYIPPEKLYGG
ncbi:ABC transporter substrate-binding protein [Candidatus Korarchaeum cryptofilum]|uniref:ABC-type branched-chain amino acid transport system, periplasmic component n=1 Tax=Korarchaeum cryptofilum (strain OPF8) TaxID=374847 RepID=B1L6B9_KORCO|nr:ABC transporter substrate-binding protein [Candidatus Korarchaeum cryptofilum]ACB07998.1 ABC-type branched-chain amino acid transport system, periplasmic component [Candidatus Korarchaeum cryptofilum OPF8]